MCFQQLIFKMLKLVNAFLVLGLVTMLLISIYVDTVWNSNFSAPPKKTNLNNYYRYLERRKEKLFGRLVYSTFVGRLLGPLTSSY